MRESIKRLLFLTIIILSGQLASAEEVIELGFISPLSGELANFGTDARRAVEMALADITSSNILPGKKIKVIYEDGRCAGKQSATAASKLVSIDRVKAIVHAGCSTEVMSAAPIVEKAQVVFLASVSESADITHAGDFIFRISPNTRIGGKDVANWLAREGFKNVAVISENSDYALSLRDVVVASLRELTIPVAVDLTYNTEESDFRALLLRIRSKEPDVIFVNPQAGLRAGLIVKQLRDLNWSIPIYGNYAFGLLDAPKAAGGIHVLDGVRFIDYPVITSASGKKLLSRFQSDYGPPQSNFNIAATYDAVFLIASAIKAVGYKATAIRDYFYKLPKFEGTAFTYRFDKYGDAQGVHYSKKVIENGKTIVIEP